MKKFLSLVLAAMMLLSVACAANIFEEEDLEAALELNRDPAVTCATWEGEWVLVAAYISEDFAEEYEVETTGLIAVPEAAAKLNIVLTADATANDKGLGTMVDVASYIHGHVLDMVDSTLVFADGDTYTVKSAWDEWPNYDIRGENDGDFNFGPAKTHIKGENETLRFAELTGIEIEDLETMKYIGLTEGGYLVLSYSDDNLAKKAGDIGVCYIFVRAE